MLCNIMAKRSDRRQIVRVRDTMKQPDDHKVTQRTSGGISASMASISFSISVISLSRIGGIFTLQSSQSAASTDANY